MNTARSRDQAEEADRMHARRELLVRVLMAVAVYGVLNVPLLKYCGAEWAAGHVGQALIAGAIALATVLTLVTGALQWSVRATLLLAAVLMVSLTTNLTTAFLARGDVSRSDIVWIWAEADRLGDVLQVFGRKAVVPLVIALAALAAYWWLARPMRPLVEPVLGEERFRRMRLWSTLAFVGVSTGYGFILPVGPVETNLFAFGIFAASQSAPEEAKLTLKPASSRYRKVVILMDESVRSDAFASQVAHRLPEGAVDLGAALSTGNCSASSNAAMRWGVRRTDIGNARDLRVNPTLWQFAKLAGFRTVLIDGQSAGKQQNFVSPHEVAQIDEFIAASAGFETDSRIFTLLKERLETSQPEFIYVVMRGSHWPYAGNLAPATNARGLSRLQGYLESVEFVTGGFLARLNNQMFAGDDAILFYTSDHGQRFGQGSTHCSSEFLLDEYLVPMLVIGSGRLQSEIRFAKSCNVDRADHQQLRTTALLAMGYSWSDLEKAAYFPPLTICASPGGAARLRGKLPWVTTRGEALDLSLWDGAPRRPRTRAQ